MTRQSLVRWAVLVVLLAGGTLLLAGCGRDDPRKSKNQPQGADVNREALASFSNPRSIAGELVYVPIFSSAMHQSGNREYLLTATLRIHNIDLTENIELSAVSYFDTEGKLVREFLDEEAARAPLDDLVGLFDPDLDLDPELLEDLYFAVAPRMERRPFPIENTVYSLPRSARLAHTRSPSVSAFAFSRSLIGTP